MKAFFKRLLGYGYSGGPDVYPKQNSSVLLSNDIMTFQIPCANPMQFPLVFPYQQPGWFELHAERDRSEHYVCISQQCYWYSGHILKTHGEPLGKLKLTIRLHKVCAEQQLVRHDMTRLAAYLQQYAISQSKKCSLLTGDYSYNRQHFKLDATDSEHYATIRQQTTLPRCYKVIDVGQQRWLYYADSQQAGSKQQHYYSYPLAEQYYLVIGFAYNANLPALFHYWHANARAAQQLIMQQMTLHLSDM